MTAARDAEEIEPGTIVVREGDPIENLCVEVERRRIHALGTPLLGTVHGKMSRKRSFELLAPLLAEVTGLERIWIVRPSD